MMRKAFLGLALAAGFSICAAAETASVSPDKTGTYTYQYPGLEANTPYVVLVTEGLSDEGDKPVITADSVLYYNVFFSDGDGTLPITFVPTDYRDATLFIASGGLSSPIIGCHVLADGAEGLSHIELSFEKDSYTVLGEGRYTLVPYTVRAFDAFGFETDLPGDAVISLNSNDGGHIRMLSESDTLELNGMTNEGTYTLTVKTGSTSVSKSFDVVRAPVPTTLRYTALSEGREDETEYSTYIIFGTETVKGIEYDPASITFMPVVYDQYGERMDTDLTFSYAEYDKYDVAGSEVLYSTGKDCLFVPPRDPAIDEKLTFDFFIRTNTEPHLTATISVIVVGSTVYNGKSLALYNRLGGALEYQAKVQSGIIAVAEDGSAVPNSMQYVKPDMAERLDRVIEETTAMLIKSAGEEGVSDALITEQEDRLQNVITAFGKALTTGSYSRITSLGFDSSHIYIAVGSSKTTTANVTPLRPSERPVYSSADPSIAVVSASTGTVTAKSEGETTITVSDVHGSISASYTLTVYTPVTSVTAVQNTVTANVGSMMTDLFRFSPDNNTDIITYSSSNTSVAAVGRTSGIVQLISAGSAVITASSMSGKSASVNVRSVCPYLELSPTAVLPGAEAVLCVSMRDAVCVNSLTVRLYYDNTVLTFNGLHDLGALGATPSIRQKTGYIEVDYTGISSDTPLSGSLFELAFTVSDKASFGKIEIEYDADAKDVNSRILDIRMPDGQSTCITVADILPGDIDSNGIVDGADLLRLAKYCVGFDVVINPQNADIDGSGSVTKDDLTLLADHFVGKTTGNAVLDNE